MNPVTRALLDRLGAHPIEAFVSDWDALEELIIRVYKNATATIADESEYKRLQTRLAESYANWQDALRPFWQGKPAGGRPAARDPVLLLIAPEAACEFVGDWSAMQTLPVSRQALNEYLMKLLEGDNGN